jgi:uncharacterized iron-regulated membrane protein
MRKYHRIVSIFVALPFLIILLTGLALLMRNQFEFIQPEPVKMQKESGLNLLTYEQIIEKSGVLQESIDQIIFKPKKFHLSLRLKNGEELQMHPQTGIILKKAMRRTNFLIDIHQGTIAGDVGQYLIALPTALCLLFLLISGLIIFPRRKSL